MTDLFEDGIDIFQILDAIEKHAGFFILKAQLDYLYCFISGYKWLAGVTGTEIKNIEQLSDFSIFLKNELDEEYENSMGWFGILNFRFGNDDGYKKFFEYLHKFKSTNNKE